MWRISCRYCTASKEALLLFLVIAYDVWQDLVNSCKRRRQKLEEWFVAVLTIHLIDIVEQMHRCQIIHADFKPDNVLVTQLWALPLLLFCLQLMFQFYIKQYWAIFSIQYSAILSFVPFAHSHCNGFIYMVLFFVSHDLPVRQFYVSHCSDIIIPRRPPVGKAGDIVM